MYISFINGYLFFRCLEKVLEEERYKKKKVEGYNKLYTVEGDREVKYRDDEILGFDFVFGG